jgi:flagellar motor switch protein FliM
VSDEPVGDAEEPVMGADRADQVDAEVEPDVVEADGDEPDAAASEPAVRELEESDVEPPLVDPVALEGPVPFGTEADEGLPLGDMPEPVAGPQSRQPRIRDIDFSRPTKFSQEHQRRIVRLHETFCRAISTQLSPELRLPLEFEIINATQLSWASATAELPSASLFGIMDVVPGTERALIACELPLLHFCLDRMLGGDGTVSQGRDELTEIELALSQRLIERLTSQLSLVWAESVDTTFELEHVDTQIANVQLVTASEAVLALTVEVKLERGSSTFTVLFPHVAVEPILEKLSVGHFGDRQHVDYDGGPVRAALLPIEVELRVDVGSVELTVDQALRLEPGEVLEFGAIEAGVHLFGGDTPTHVCRPGRVGEFRAVEILAQTQVGARS